VGGDKLLYVNWLHREGLLRKRLPVVLQLRRDGLLFRMHLALL
jgi:hypothetical protein